MNIKKIAAVALLIFVLLISLGFNFFALYQADPLGLKNRSIKQKLQEHMLIYETEEPSVTTIKDVELLKQANFAFYRDAQNGDKVVFFPNRAIVYREKEDKIIAVTLISLGDVEEDQVD